jgi:choline monooxygenase
MTGVATAQSFGARRPRIESLQQSRDNRQRGTVMLSHGHATNGNVPTTPDYTRVETYKATRVPVELATTLIPDAYRSDAFYALEQERVFVRGWVCVGYTDQVRSPGDTFVRTVAGQPILVTRDQQGQIRAFFNVCRHRGAKLVDCDGPQSVLRCPYHHWGYALDGRLLGTPYFKGMDIPEDQQEAFRLCEVKNFRKEDYSLLPVRVDSWGCFVFVNLDGHARPLSEWLGDLPERFARHPLHDLRLVRRRPFQIRSNWKLIAENFMEYYHLPWVHPELCNVSGFKDHYRYQGPGMYTGMCTTPLTIDPNTVRFDLPNMPGLNASESVSAFWVLICPNVALFLLPNHLFTLLLQPDGVGQTVESADMLVHPNALAVPDADRQIDAILSFWAMVNEQDIKAVECVQQGLQAKAYPGGRMCFHFEEPIHRYQNMVIELMTGQPPPAGIIRDEPLVSTDWPAR